MNNSVVISDDNFSDALDNSTAIDSLQKTIVELKKELFAIKFSQEEVIKSITFCGDKISDFEKLIGDLHAQRKVVEEIKKDNESLRSELAECQYKIQELEQRSRIDNLEIQGIPDKPTENLLNIMENLGSSIGCEIAASDISTVHRVQHVNNQSRRPRNIIVKLVSRHKKDAILAAAKKFRKNSPAQGDRPGIKIHGLGDSIFINEHLSNGYKSLLKNTKDAARSRGYKYVWVRNCTIFVRKTETHPAKTIKNLADINKM